MGTEESIVSLAEIVVVSNLADKVIGSEKKKRRKGGIFGM
jgi:hypothetical protein